MYDSVKLVNVMEINMIKNERPPTVLILDKK